MGTLLIARTILVAAAVAAIATPAFADTVVRRDGARLEGRVVSVDEAWVVLASEAGTSRIGREDVAAIHFAGSPPPLRVEVRVARADDAVDVVLDDQVILTEARSSTSWTDVTDRLKEGNQPLRLRIRNDRGGWSYRVHVRINGEVSVLECGDARAPCTCCGATGYEVGWIEDVPPVWIHVDRGLGRAELQR